LKSDLKRRAPLLIACALVIASALLSSPDVLAEVTPRVTACELPR
jgi:hypothetical protein